MTKDECILCRIVNGNVPSKKIYEDEEILAVLDVNGATPGHCFVMPKEHFTIFEQIPDELTARLFEVANKVSTAIFESLDVKGTNIFVTNGIAAGQVVAHFIINVIPRNDNDGINLQWQTKQLTEEEMSTVELQLKDSAKNVGVASEQKPTKTEKQKKEEPITDEENYLSKQINRIP